MGWIMVVMMSSGYSSSTPAGFQVGPFATRELCVDASRYVQKNTAGIANAARTVCVPTGVKP